MHTDHTQQKVFVAQFDGIAVFLKDQISYHDHKSRQAALHLHLFVAQDVIEKIIRVLRRFVVSFLLGFVQVHVHRQLQNVRLVQFLNAFELEKLRLVVAVERADQLAIEKFGVVAVGLIVVFQRARILEDSAR